MKPFQMPRVYPITSDQNRHGLSHLELACRYLDGGATLVQARSKTLSDRAFLEQLLAIRKVCNQHGAILIVNDRVDLAAASGADGVHLGQEDLPIDTARRFLGTDAIIGISTHNGDQFREALQQDIDYVAAGPIFHTSTKVSEYPSLGCEFLRQLRGHTGRPIVAIGGITLSKAPDVWRSGADSVAVISDLADAEDPTARIRQYFRAAQEIAE